MKTVFQGDAINMLISSHGLIIAYAHDYLDEKVAVAFKMLSFDSGKIANVSKNIYEISKFGTNYRQTENHVKNYILSKTTALPNNRLFILNNDGTACLCESDGEAIWKGKIEYHGYSPSSITINNRNIWTCYKENNVMMRLNLTSMREELRIGGGSSSPFSEPVDLFSDDDDIYVCNSASNTIVKVNTKTYITEIYREFDCPVRQFIKANGYEFVLLDTGVYLLD